MQKKVLEFTSEKSGEKIIEWKKCKWTGEDFAIFEKEIELMENIAPIFKGKKYSFPLHKLSPKARAIKRMMFRNERSLYKRKSDLSGENILSTYPSNFEGKVFSVSEHNSDKLNLKKYSKEFDENIDIKEQIIDFYKAIPRKSVNLDEAIGLENCDYCNFGFSSKNSYMCQAPIASQDCYYSFTPLHCNNIIDGHLMTYSENCYDSINCVKCYKVFYSQSLQECSDCYSSYNLTNCKNCIGCIDLNGKEYYIFNKKVDKKEFDEKLKNILSSFESVEKFRKEFNNFSKDFPKKSVFNVNSEKCFGTGFQNSNNVLIGFDVVGIDNGIYNILTGMTTDNVIDTYAVGLNVSNLYNSIGVSNSTKSAFGEFGSANNTYYFSDCRNIDNCFLCFGLKNKEFCIFNKQYSKEEYNQLVPKIIKKLEKLGMWGEFFDVENSPFPYNDSVANIFYPVKKVVFLDKNKNILKTEINDESGEGIVYILESDKFISKAILDLGGEEKIKIKYRTKENEIELPQNMDGVIICKKTKRPFKLIKQEIEFYNKFNIPFPEYHPDIRFKNRLNKRAKLDLFIKKCEECNIETLTAWEKEKIICEKCYDKNKY